MSQTSRIVLLGIFFGTCFGVETLGPATSKPITDFACCNSTGPCTACTATDKAKGIHANFCDPSGYRQPLRCVVEKEDQATVCEVRRALTNSDFHTARKSVFLTHKNCNNEAGLSFSAFLCWNAVALAVAVPVMFWRKRLSRGQ